MDKNEYKSKYNEMRAFINEGKMEEALDIIDSMNWRKVHNVNALVKASEVCEEAGRLEEARDLLELAHERSPIGRMIIYHLAIICVKMGDLDEASAYYDEFVEIAPHDSLKYIIKYQLNKAKGADYITLIAILEELKDHDFLEEWSYELAYLYHKSLQIDKCIELCDEIILWFGDGPYVERALEMKMIYQPLDKLQEDKYRSFQQKRDGITEIKANEVLNSGEIISETIAIPRVELPPERFNTVNLQAEIKKNIDEIMRATEAEAVSENMDIIKSLVEEIPYLQVTDEKALAESNDEIAQINEEIDATIMDSFKEYLAEEYDGQISLLVPEQKEIEEQIEGQMSIEDVMEEWEKTRRAAEAALQDAEQQKLESAKNIALKEAEQIMDRLEEAMPKLDAGATPTDLLKEEYMAKETSPAPTFSIPKVHLDDVEEEVGLELPIIDPEGVKIIKGDLLEEAPAITKQEEQKDTKEWQPPILDEAQEEESQEVLLEEEDEQPELEMDLEGMAVDYKEASKIVEGVNQMLQKEIDRMLEEENNTEDIEEDVPEEVTPEEAEAEDELPEIAPVTLDEEELAELVNEDILEKAIQEELPQMKLTEEEKEIFSYFMPISGMETTICQALAGVKHHLKERLDSSSGNIIIIGGDGSGKTMLASNLIKVLQIETGLLQGNTGKIDAEQLNGKSVTKVFSAVKDGCLIIENAAALSEQTMESLRQQMVRKDNPVLVLMEGKKQEMESLLSQNTALGAMFTEKITIPIFTIDELVNFGKVYALEEGYSIDEMGILAMYNRINIIQRLDHPTSLIEVRDIVEEAMEHAEKGGLKAAFSRIGTKRYDEDGNVILHEQDFEL